jgi:prepilin-type N-terminal cleavage/methylation domain-containing protein
VSARSAQGGFTVIEVLVAVLVLGVGITAMVGTSALVTRQIGRGRIVTVANQLANQKLDQLRRSAARKVGGNYCADANFASGGPVTTRGVTYSWTISGTGNARTVTVTASYPVGTGTKSFSITTMVGCYS